LMSQSILPAADALDRANREALDRDYAAVTRSSRWLLFLVFLAGAALLGVLVLVQVFLYRRMRRLVNPALAAATLLALVFLGYVLVSFLGQRAALRVAMKDCFESIHLLWQARAQAYDANGDESRWLLDRQRAAEHEKDYFLK